MDYFLTEQQQEIKSIAAKIAKEKIEPVALEIGRASCRERV